MPGIVGLVTKMPRAEAVAELRQMVELLLHEPFYSSGTWIDERCGFYVGWTSPESDSCDMPLRSEREGTILMFSGEEFSEPRVAGRTLERYHESDQSYLVRLYEQDKSFPGRLNGRFHGFLADLNRGRGVLFNDRYGMHRVYYHESNRAFYFAAEAKAILAVRPELRRLAPRSLGEFVACGSVLENRTLFQDIHVLPPGSAWIFRDGSLERKNSYFHPKEWEDQGPLDSESYYNELREVFGRNLEGYFTGRRHIGMSLTGGLDTRMIMAWRKPQSESLPCYTFGGMLGDCQDVIVARRVAQVSQQPHQVIRLERDFLSRFSHYAARAVYLTDGCVDVGRAPDLYLNERARQVAPVRMTGNYGGEVLRRVRAFKPEDPVSGLFQPELESDIRRAKQTYNGLLRCHPLSFAVFRQGPWHHYGILALEQTQVFLRSPFLDNDFVRTVFRAPRGTLASNDVSLRLIADGNPDLLRIRTDRGLDGTGRSISGATVRALRQIEFKAEYAYDIGMPQWVARADHLVSPLRLERLFLGRHKIFHFRTWYRDALAPYVRDMLLDPRSLSRPYIDRKSAESLVRGHLKGNCNYTAELHKLLTLELFHRLFLDQTGRMKARDISSARPVTLNGQLQRG